MGWNAGWLAAFALLAPASYHRAADIAKDDNQTGLASPSSPPWACKEIALGLFSTVVPTLLRVALQGSFGAFPAIDEWCVAMMLTWPWWSLEGSCLRVHVELATLQKEALVLDVVPPQ